MKLGSWKTTTAGLTGLAGFIAMIAKLIGEHRMPTTDEVVILLGCLSSFGGGIFARDNDKTSEEVGAKPDTIAYVQPPRMTGSTASEKTIVSIALLAGLLCFAGCSTTGTKDPTTNPQAETNLLVRIRLITQLAASTGARIDLQRNPDHRAAYEAANQSLALIIRAKDFSPDKLREALSNLPIDELRGEGGNVVIYIDAAVTLWNLTLLDMTVANSAPRVQAFAEGIHEGLNQALMMKPPNDDLKG